MRCLYLGHWLMLTAFAIVSAEIKEYDFGTGDADASDEDGDNWRQNFLLPDDHDTFPDPLSGRKKDKLILPDDGIYLPHEKYCKLFYLFDGQQALILSCPRGQRFDDEKLKCKKKKEVKCGKRKQYVGDTSSSEEFGNTEFTFDFRCSQSNGDYPHGHYCHLFYRCDKKKAKILMCPQGMLFDAEQLTCRHGSRVSCDKREKPDGFDEDYETDDELDVTTTTDDGVVCPSSFGVYPHPRECQKFLRCWFHFVDVDTCPDGQLFDDDLNLCRREQSVNCRGRKNPYDLEDDLEFIIIDENPDFYCPLYQGRFPHEDCAMFFDCFNGAARLYACPLGKLYDVFEEKCKDSATVDCTGNFPGGKDDDDLDFICPNREGRFRHEGNCGAYYVCSQGQAKLHHCPEGTLYDVPSRKCEDEEDVTCGDRIHPKDDPEESQDGIIDPYPQYECKRRHGRFTHETYCNWYYNCRDNKPTVRECREGKFYDSQENKCFDSWEVNCEDRIRPEDNTITEKPEFQCPYKTGKFPHERDCGAFYECKNGKHKQHRCPKDKLYDDNRRSCEDDDHVSCGDRIHPNNDPDEPRDKVIDPNPSFNCKRRYGSYPHEEFCDWYYNCHDKKATLQECRWGRLFDSRRHKCYSWWEVICDDREKPEGLKTTVVPTVKTTAAATTTTRKPTTVTERVTRYPDFICPSKDGKYDHERNCRDYYECKKGQFKLHHCPEDKLYDSKKRKCEKEDHVKCGDRLHPDDDPDEPEDKIVDPNPKFECKKPHGRFTHDSYCHWYYRCHDSESSVRECRRGRYYDTKKQKCVDSWEVDCEKRKEPEDMQTTTTTSRTTTRSTPSKTTTDQGKYTTTSRKEVTVTRSPGFVCPSKDGKYPHETNCGDFYECIKGDFKIHHCPKDKLFDSQKLKCEDEDRVTCGDRLHPDDDPDEPQDKIVDPNPKFDCKESHGRFTHDDYCNWYYHCQDKKSSVRECRRGRYYDTKRCKCVDAWEVDCEKRKEPEDTAKTTRYVTETARTTTKTGTPTKNIENTTPRRPPTTGQTETPSKYTGNTDTQEPSKTVTTATPSKYTGSTDTQEPSTTVATAETTTFYTRPERTTEGIIHDKFDCYNQRGRIPHYRYCDKYYECGVGTTTLVECNDGEYYDVGRQECIEWWLVICDDRVDSKDFPEFQTSKIPEIPTTVKPTTKEITPEPKIIICPESEGIFADEKNCGKYYVCKNSIGEEMMCPEGQLFNLGQLKCTDENYVTCGERIHPRDEPDKPQDKIIDEDPDFNCTVPHGCYTHEMFCKWYYHCHDKRPSLRECSNGTYFDTNRFKCLEWWMVFCDNRITDVPTTTTEIPTTVRRPTTASYKDIITTQTAMFDTEFECPVAMGAFPHHTECNKFYACWNGKQESVSCPDWELYDSKEKKCRPRVKVNCEDRRDPYPVL